MKSGKSLRTRIVLCLVVALAALAVPDAARADDVGPSDPNAYRPGSAIAKILGYDVDTWSKMWGCSYTGWASPTKDWECELYDSTWGVRLKREAGSFTGSWKDTPTYYYLTSNQVFCARAEANYRDGSSGDSDQKCG